MSVTLVFESVQSKGWSNVRESGPQMSEKMWTWVCLFNFLYVMGLTIHLIIWVQDKQNTSKYVVTSFEAT